MGFNNKKKDSCIGHFRNPAFFRFFFCGLCYHTYLIGFACAPLQFYSLLHCSCTCLFGLLCLFPFLFFCFLAKAAAFSSPERIRTAGVAVVSAFSPLLVGAEELGLPTKNSARTKGKKTRSSTSSSSTHKHTHTNTRSLTQTQRCLANFSYFFFIYFVLLRNFRCRHRVRLFGFCYWS